MNGKYGPVLGLVVLVLLLAAGIYRMREASPEAAVPKGTSLPDVETVTLDGQKWRLSEQRGKVVLLDFWATWCGPCLMSMPHMRAVYEQFKSNPDFVMVGVSLDHEVNSLSRFMEQQKLPWVQLFDPQQPLARLFGIGSIPSVWVLDRSGRVVGGYIDPSNIEKIVAEQLARK